ncbi:MAG: elongation factor P, partial [Planctomycetes bacterium]|nr:elongation factor P [Planctomycetota bacterium]
MVLNVEGSLFLVTEFQHITPGNWRAMVQAKLKNLKTGKIVQQRFRSTDSIDAAFL